MCHAKREWSVSDGYHNSNESYHGVENTHLHCLNTFTWKLSKINMSFGCYVQAFTWAYILAIYKYVLAGH